MNLDQRLVNELAQKFLSGAATDEEKRCLHQWYNTVNVGDLEIVLHKEPINPESFGDEALKELRRMIAEEKSDGLRQSTYEQRSGDLGQATGEQIPGGERPTAVIRRLPWRRYAIAASLIFLLGLGLYLFRIHPSQKETVIRHSPDVKYKNDVLPGRNKAVLTLANGASIVLDSAGNGELARQGNTKVMKLANGQLAYSATGRKTTETLYNTMAVPRGGQYQLLLPDGTQVWLNAASSIRYPTAFAGRERQVEITGEAYFEVARNPKMPFVVVINKSERVEVLGTHFNINAYEDETSVNTTLLEGSVKVVKENEAKVLTPGQEARAGKDGGITLIRNANTEAAVAWKNGVFLFDHSDIKSVMRQLARWYDVAVEYRGKPTTDLFGGDIRRSMPLSKVCRFLEESQVHFSIEGQKIIVTP